MMKKAKVNYEGAMKQFDALLPDGMPTVVLFSFIYLIKVSKSLKNECFQITKMIIKTHSQNAKMQLAVRKMLVKRRIK